MALWPVNSVHSSLPVAFSPDLKPIHISNPTYNTYVRPQLKGMVSEFYSLLKRLHPLEEYFVRMKESLLKMEDDRRLWEKKCALLKDPQCWDLALNLKEQVVNIEKEALEALRLNSRAKNFEQNFQTHAEEELDTTLELHGLLEGALASLSTLNLWLEQFLFQLKTKQPAPHGQEKNFEQALLHLDVTLDVLLVEATPAICREKFRAVWSNFIKKIEKNILLQDRPSYLGKNLGDLNFILNEFNIYIDKKRNPVARALGPQMEDIHGRWNSILRIILD